MPTAKDLAHLGPAHARLAPLDAAFEDVDARLQAAYEASGWSPMELFTAPPPTVAELRAEWDRAKRALAEETRSGEAEREAEWIKACDEDRL